jgi:hypothetical protein
MPSLLEALDQMELRLQSLIEGNLARLLPIADNQHHFAHRFIEAFRENIHTNPAGIHSAPHAITLHAAPEVVDFIRKHPALLDELSEQIEVAATDVHIIFSAPPLFQLIANPDLNHDQFQFSFTNDSFRPGTTAILPAAPGAHNQSIPRSSYLILEGSQLFNLSQVVTNIGRKEDNQLAINDRRISRYHAQIRASQGKFVIFDLQSSGGTFLNGQRIHQAVLRSGDVISLAGVLIVFGQEITDDFGKTEEFRPGL